MWRRGEESMMDQATDKMMAQHIANERGWENLTILVQGERIEDWPGNRQDDGPAHSKRGRLGESNECGAWGKNLIWDRQQTR